MHPTNPAGLRGLVRGMKQGHVVVLLPDQVPTGEGGWRDESDSLAKMRLDNVPGKTHKSRR